MPVAGGSSCTRREVARARSRSSTSRAPSRGSRRARGRTASRGRAERRSRARRRRRPPGDAVPQPYQAGSRQRFCVHAKTQGIARSELARPAAVGRDRPGGAIFQQRELVDRREAAEERREAPGPPRRARGTPPRGLGEARVSCSGPPLRRREARSLGEEREERRRDRRLEVSLRASPCRPYLKEIVSPCSVSGAARRRRPGAARGSPRRSARRRGRCCRRGRGRSSARRRARPRAPTSSSCAVDLPVGREVAAVLGGVGVADHHLERVARAPVEELAREEDARRAGRRSSRAGARRERLARVAREVSARGRRRRSRSSRRSRGRSSAARGARAPGARRERGNDRLGLLSHLLRVDAEVERGDVQSEDLDAGPEIGERAVGDRGRRRARGAWHHAGQVVRELVAVAVLVGGEPLPDSDLEGAVRLVAPPSRARERGRRPRWTCPTRSRAARTSRRRRSRASVRARSSASTPSRRRSFGLPSMSPPIQVPSGAEAAPRGSPRAARARAAAAPARGRLDEPEPVADLVDDARPRRRAPRRSATGP